MEGIASPYHSAWASGTSVTLFEILGRSAPISLLGAGINRIEHMCRPAEAGHDFEYVPFSELAKTWNLPTSRRVVTEWRTLVQDLSRLDHGGRAWWPRGDHRHSARRPLSNKELWDGTRRILTNGNLADGWPLGDTRQSRWRGGQFCEKLCSARANGTRHSKAEWAAALRQSYGDVSVAPAREWRDGAPTDVDKFGTLVATVWPEADYRTGGSYKAYGGVLNRDEDGLGKGAHRGHQRLGGGRQRGPRGSWSHRRAGRMGTFSAHTPAAAGH